MLQILLIDDDDLLRETVADMLEADGHRVSAATDGPQAMALYARGRFDLVITDMLMPEMDGASVITALRDKAPALPIVAISGGRRVLTPGFSLRTAKLLGATVTLTKPFGRAELRDALAAATA